MSAQGIALEDYVSHAWVAGGVASFQRLLDIAEFHDRLTLEDAVDAWRAIGELRRISRDFDGDPRDALGLIDTWSRRLRDLAYGASV